VSNDLDLAIALLGDLDNIAEVTSAALDLNAVVKELLERLDVEDLVVDGLAAVDDELLRHLLGLLAGGCLLHGRISLLYCTSYTMCVMRDHRQQSGVRTVLGAIFVVWESAKKWLSCVERVRC